MTDKEIKTLVARYFDGDTTLAEEQSLRDYFTGPAVAAELEEYRPLFAYFAAARQPQTSADFEARLLERLEAEATAPPVATTPVRRMLRTWQKVAAVLLLLGASLYTIHQCSRWTETQATVPAYNGPVAAAGIDWSKYEVTDEAEALAITRAALGATSKKLNQNSRRAATSVHAQLTKVLQ